MNVAKAEEIIDCHFENGRLYENGTKRLITPKALQKTIEKLEGQLHDYSISPGTTSMMNDAARYHKALKVIQNFYTFLKSLK